MKRRRRDASRRDVPKAADVGLEIDKPRGADGVWRFSHEAMAAVFEVYAAHPDQRYAAQASHAAFLLADRL